MTASTTEGTSRLLTVAEAAKQVGVPAATLLAWRYAGHGPR